MVVQGEADLGLVRSLHHPEVETLSLREDPLLLVAEPRGRPARARRLPLEDVAGQPLIFFDRDSSDWNLTQSLFRGAGLVPNIVMEVEAIETAKRMVLRGIGVAFLPYLAVAHELRAGSLIALDVADAPRLSRSLDVIHPRARPLGPEARALLGVFRAAVAAAPARPRPGRGYRPGGRT